MVLHRYEVLPLLMPDEKYIEIRQKANQWAFEPGLQQVSEIFPNVAEHADKLCVIRSMRTDNPNHEPGLLMMNSGNMQPIRPSMGSWVTYGLGSENQNLPGYVVLCPGRPVVGPQLWSNSFLPAAYQGMAVPGFPNLLPAIVAPAQDDLVDISLWSPRVGFNWDVTGDQVNQLRGGIGSFSGGVPFVYLSNAFGNSGLSGFSSLTCNGSSATTEAVAGDTTPKAESATAPTKVAADPTPSEASKPEPSEPSLASAQRVAAACA